MIGNKAKGFFQYIKKGDQITVSADNIKEEGKVISINDYSLQS